LCCMAALGSGVVSFSPYLVTWGSGCLGAPRLGLQKLPDSWHCTVQLRACYRAPCSCGVLHPLFLWWLQRTYSQSSSTASLFALSLLFSGVILFLVSSVTFSEDFSILLQLLWIFHNCISLLKYKVLLPPALPNWKWSTNVHSSSFLPGTLFEKARKLDFFFFPATI